jgi:hypothetical protein
MARAFFSRVSVASILALAVAVASPALAQRKKPATKKPAATAPAKHKKGAPKPAPAPPPPAPPAEEPAPPPPEPKPAPRPRSKKVTTVVATPSVAETPDFEPERPAPSREAETPRGPLLDAELGVHGFQRHLRYSGDTFGVLPGYDLGGAPAGALEVSVYPYRTKTFSLGLAGSFEYAFALGSKFKAAPAGQAEGATYTTQSLAYSIGPDAEYYFGRLSSVGLGVDYGMQSYSVDLPPPTPTDAGVPDVSYSFIRPRLHARFGLTDKIALFAGVGYLLILKAGEIVSSTYFSASRSSASGIEANLGGVYQIAPHFEVRLALDYRLYSLTFTPLTTDPYIASGATDTFFGATLGMAYRM